MVSTHAEEGHEVQRGNMDWSGSHSTLAAKQGYFRLEKPLQSTMNKTKTQNRNTWPTLKNAGEFYDLYI